MIGLRNYAQGQGVNVGWDEKTGNVSLNNKAYTPSQLKGMGGQLVNNSWVLPQDAINNLFPKATSNSVPSNTPNNNNDMASILSQINKTINQPSGYETQLQTLLKNAPQYTPKSDAELTGMAQNRADIQISPLLSALRRQQAEGRQALASQADMVKANYSGIGETANRLLKDIEARGQEAAIARGGGRSGATEYITGKMSEPVLEQVSQSERERQAALQGIADKGSLLDRQLGDQMTETEASRGQITNAILDALRREEQALSTGNWQSQASVLAGLSGLEQNKNAQNISGTLGLLPYFTPTAAEKDNLTYRYSDLFGQQAPGYNDASLKTMNLRDFVENRGGVVDWNANTNGVIVNGKEYSPDYLTGQGAFFDTNSGRWKIPQSVANKLFG